MHIKSINIIGFGKFKNETISFNDGLNVIYGKNEAGKSTTHSFIKAMLFGIKKSKSRNKIDYYSKYTPWDEYASFEGTLDFTHEDKNYRIHRIFSEDSALLEVRNLDANRKVPNPELFLNKVLCNLNTESFDNTISIGQMKTAQDSSVAQDLRRYISNLNTSGDMSINTIAAINFLKHKKESLMLGLKNDVTMLYNKQLGNIRNIEKELSSKEYINLLPKILKAKTIDTNKIDDNNKEINKLKQEIAENTLTLENYGFNSEDDIDSLKSEVEKVYLEYCPIANNEMNIAKIILNIGLILLGIAVITFNTLLLVVTYPGIADSLNLTNVTDSQRGLANFIVNLPFHPSLLIGFLYCIGLILIVGDLLLLFFNYQNAKIANGTRDILCEVFKQHIKTDKVNRIMMNQFRKHIANMKKLCTSIKESEARIMVLTKENNKLLTKQGEYDEKIRAQEKIQYDVEQKYNELNELKNESEKTKINMDENDTLTREIDSIDMAIETLYALADQIHVMFGTHLNSKASEYIEGLTGGKYKSLNVDDSMQVSINFENKFIPLTQVSTGTMDQIYLAMRLATYDVIKGDNEVLPLLFDDCFAMYDNDRLTSSLKYLDATFDTQVLIFTCHTREAALLGHNNIKFNKIEI